MEIILACVFHTNLLKMPALMYVFNTLMCGICFYKSMSTVCKFFILFMGAHFCRFSHKEATQNKQVKSQIISCHETVSFRYVAFEDLRAQNAQSCGRPTTFNPPITAQKGYISVAQAFDLTSPLEDQRSGSTYKVNSVAPTSATLREPAVADENHCNWPSRPTSMAEVSKIM